MAFFTYLGIPESLAAKRLKSFKDSVQPKTFPKSWETNKTELAAIKQRQAQQLEDRRKEFLRKEAQLDGLRFLNEADQPIPFYKDNPVEIHKRSPLFARLMAYCQLDASGKRLPPVVGQVRDPSFAYSETDPSLVEDEPDDLDNLAIVQDGMILQGEPGTVPGQVASFEVASVTPVADAEEAPAPEPQKPATKKPATKKKK